MNRLTLRLTIALLTFVAGVTASAFWFFQQQEPSNESKPRVSQQQAEQDASASLHGAAFNYDSSLASNVESKIISAFALNYETDIPDSVTPKHFAYTFVGSYASQHEESFYSPEIHIYPIVEYKKALSLSESYVQQFEDKMEILRLMFSQRPATWAEEIPVYFGQSGSQTFRTHVKYVDFKNGRGVMYLTQCDIEQSLINDSGLTYVFQGLTSDGVNYVTATFPVTAPTLNLPASYDGESYEDFNLRTYQRDLYKRDGGKKYESYLKKMRRKLEALSPDDYEPKLPLFEKLIRSLKVEEQMVKKNP